MRSQSATNAVNTNKMIKTTSVLCWSWSRFGQVTRRSSPRTLRTNSAAPANLPFCCVAPFPALRLLAITSSPDLVLKSRAGGTRTPDLRFWRPLLYQLSYCPLPTWSPGAPYVAGTTGNTSSTGCGPACCAGSYGYGSSGACTPHMPALPIVAQDPPDHRGEANHPAPVRKVALLDYLCYDASPYGPAPLADGKVQPLVHGDRRDQLHVHHRVVPRHHHLYPLLHPYLPRHVRSPEVKLRTVVAEERRVPSSLFFGEDVHFGLELGVRGYRARLCQNLSALYVVALYSS